MSRLLLALLACLLPALTACADGAQPAPDAVEVTEPAAAQSDAPAAGLRELARGQHSRYAEGRGSQVLVLRTEQEFAAFWRKHTGDDEQAMPTVDFSSELVIAAIDQQRTSGGYAVTVDAVELRAATITGITVATRHPGPRSMTTSVMTRPYHIVAHPRPDER